MDYHQQKETRDAPLSLTDFCLGWHLDWRRLSRPRHRHRYCGAVAAALVQG